MASEQFARYRQLGNLSLSRRVALLRRRKSEPRSVLPIYRQAGGWFGDEANVGRFLRKHPRSRGEIDNLINFVMESYLEEHCAELDALDATAIRSIRWCISRADSEGYVLHAVTKMDRSLKQRCPTVVVQEFEEFEALAAIAIAAYQDRRISKRTLGAVMCLLPSFDEKGWLGLTKSDLRLIYATRDLCATGPIFGWCPVTDEGYYHLHAADTRRFIAFVTQAWQENWPASLLNVREEHGQIKTTIQLRNSATLAFQKDW